MIKQKLVTVKSSSTTLTYSELGEIVVTGEATITLPAPAPGCWFRIGNTSSNVVSVNYSGVLGTLKQYEHILCLANNTTDWYILKSSSTKIHFTHTQTLASNIWSITHDLGNFPSVTVVDSAGSVVTGDVLYIDDQHISVIFSAEFSGKAYLN